MFRTYFNTTDSPVVVSTDGRSIDGSGWGPADPDDERAAAVLEAGLIIEVEPPGRGVDVHPDAAEAFRLTKELNGSDTTAQRDSGASDQEATEQ